MQFNNFRKPTKLAIGLMSGTSVDGIDAALVRIKGSGLSTHIELIDFLILPFSEKDRERIKKLASRDQVSLDELTRMNARLGILFAEAAHAVAHKAGVAMQEIDLIGSHGQTVRHLPDDPECPATFQIGDPSYIVQKTGVVTVADFRPADMAAGGQGAPLVPLFDYLVFKSIKYNRVVLNIGGIANVTILPRNCTPEKVLAFDTGPGNTIVDNLCKSRFGVNFDENGALAACGKVQKDIVDIFLKDKYFDKVPPKSTGPEYFSADNLLKIIDLSSVHNLCDHDLLATVTYITAQTIFEQIKRFSSVEPDQLVVSGGGVNNFTLLKHLRGFFPQSEVLTSEELSVPVDAKEAMCFAVLAHETLQGHSGNLPSATGAEKPVVLGKICL